MDTKSKFKIGDVVRIYGEWSCYKKFLDGIGGPVGPKTRFTVSGFKEKEIENTHPPLRIFVVDVQWFVKDKFYESEFSPCFLEKVKEDK